MEVPKQLTTKSYWDATYQGRSGIKPIDLSDTLAQCEREIFALKEQIGLKNKKILEIGGGGSGWLAFLAQEYPSSEFTCLDYSEAGTEALKAYASENNLENLKIIVADMFDPPQNLDRYDFVFSHGVVEHFPDLSGVISAHSRFLNKDGIMLTVIPNMAGALGYLVKLLNRDVYNIHVPHDHASFTRGFEIASQKIIKSNYLCSTNFSVLSSCVKKRPSFVWFSYVALTLVSRLLWFFEKKIAPLPTSRLFSPYIFVISRSS